MIGGLPLLSQAQTSWTAGGAPDLTWSTFDNWSTLTSPAGQDVAFSNSNKTTQDVPSNIVDTDFTIRSLSFTNTGSGDADWHVTRIEADTTLTINNASAPTNSLLVGGMAGGSGARLTTLARIEGPGSLFINQATGNIRIGNTGHTSDQAQHQGYATLDLSGLSNFEAVINRFEIGIGRTSSATVLLADNSDITANMLVVGNTGSNAVGGHARLQLGRETRLSVDNIRIGASSDPSSSGHQNFASGTVSLQTGLDAPTIMIRGSGGGETRSAVTVGDQGSDVVANTSLQNAVLDLTGGEVDAKISTLTIGRGRGNSTSVGLNASMSIDAGVVDATTVIVGMLGNSANVNAGATVATLNIEGGNFLAETLYVARNTSTSARQTLRGRVNIEGSASVEVTNTIMLGSQGNTSNPGTIEATLDISGGTLLAKGGIAEGTNPGLVTSELILRGGTLDVNNQNIVVDTFKLESGTLRNLKEFNSGTTLEKTTLGTLIMEGINAYTGETIVSAGAFQVAGSLTGTPLVSVLSGAAIGGDGFIGGDLFLASGANLLFNISDTLDVGGSISFGGFGVANLLGLDSTVEDGIYSLVSGLINFDNVSNLGLDNAYALGGDKWAYFQADDLSLVVTTLSTVPEPATAVLLAGIAASMIAGSRRRSRTQK